MAIDRMLPACTALIVGNADSVLCVTNRKYGGWCLPGGKMSELEYSLWLPRNTTVREIYEETDVILYEREMLYLGKTPSVVEPKREVRIYYAMAASGTAMAKEPGTEVCWMSFVELQQQTLFGSFYRRMFPDGHGQPPTVWR